MAEKSKANTKGVQLNLDKTFKKGLLEGMNVDFSGFFGETDEKGDYNTAPPKKKEMNVGAGFTTKGGTKVRITHSQSKAESNPYYPKREEKSTILSIGKSFKKGGKVKKAYLGSFIAGEPSDQSNKTYRKYYKGMV